MSEQAVHDKGSEIPAGLNGLSSIHARRLLGEVGPNRWVKQDRFARVREVVRLLLDPMAVMLIIAAVVYFLLGETRDAVVLALALIPVLGVDVLLEARSRAALEKLARAAAPSADVVRDRQVVSVPLEDVVPGDLLDLREGHVIAADGVVRWVANLAIDESSLTGESEPQPKREWPSAPDEAPPDARFFAGSQAVAGHGFGVVTTTGAATQYGGIAALVAQSASSASPLQRKAGVLVRRLGVVAVIVAIALFGLSLARGEPWTRALLGAVSLAMAAIPEEFPIVLTLFLSAGAWRLASRGMLVRRLASVETPRIDDGDLHGQDRNADARRVPDDPASRVGAGGVGAGCPGGLRARVRTPSDRRDGARDWCVRSRPRRLTGQSGRPLDARPGLRLRFGRQAHVARVAGPGS